MFSLELLVLLTAAVCCTAAPTDQDSCAQPERLTEAALEGDWNDDRYPPETVATYVCRPGYSRLGHIKSTCKKGKWVFSQPKGQCKKKSCGHPGDIPFGNFDLIEGTEFVFGAVVEYTCEEGYQMVSRVRTRECTATGWSNFPPHCEVRNCPPIVIANNVNVLTTSYDEEYSVGQVVRFDCKDKKLKLNGPSEIFCNSEGGWNLDPPTCVEITCSPPLITNGRVNNPRTVPYREHELIQFTCNRGFRASRNGEASCNKDGWIPTPSCEEISCSPYQNVINGKLKIDRNVYKEGDTIALECDDNYVIEFQPHEPRRCTSNGWDPPLSCISKKCENPNVKNGALYYSYYFPRRIGTTVDIYCYADFLTAAKLTWQRILCTATGWQPEPRCWRKCPYSDAFVTNADIIEGQQSNYIEGDKVKFRCHRDFQLPNKEIIGERVCLPNGKFSSAKCQRTCKITSVTNGKLQPDKYEFEVNENVRYECNDGYMTRERNLFGNSQCLQEGWSVTPECIDITCELKGETFRNKDIVRYQCPPGKKPSGSNVIQCYYLGWGPNPSCDEITCTIPDPSLILSPHKDTYNYNDRVSFSCNQGFNRVGSKEAVCKEDGWNSPLPECQRITCPVPDKNLIGNPIKSTYVFSDRVTFSCKEGFKLDGSPHRVCTENGWDMQLPICLDEKSVKPDSDEDSDQGITCPVPNKNLIGNPIKSTYVNSDRVTFSCKEGFKIEGSPHRVCTENGWDKQLPICLDEKSVKPDSDKDSDQGITCPVPDKNLIGNPIKSTYVNSDHVTFSCKEGFKIEGSPHRVCTEIGWDEQLPICLDTREECPPAYVPKNGEIKNPREKYYRNDTIIIVCNPGYEIYGSEKIQCKDGVWQSPPQCIESKKCRDPPSIDNGEINPVSKKLSYLTDDVVTYICKKGFHMVGSDQSTCVDGRWLESPRCAENPCAEAPKIENALILGTKTDFKHGEMANYRCNVDFTFSGGSSAKCLEGKWWDIPKCVSTSCGKPPSVSNARIGKQKTSYKSGEKVTYTCNNGYVLDKSMKAEATCENSNWKDTPVCRKYGESCGVPPVIEFGDTLGSRRSAYESGSYVEYKCPDFHVIKGQSRIKCENGVWEEAPICLEPCTAKEKEMKENNIRFRFIADQKLYSRHGVQMEFICIDGYENSLSSNMRVTCERGVLPYPTCFKADSCVLNQETMTGNNIHFNTSTVIEHGRTIMFECNEGMVAENKLGGKCTKKEMSYPKCITASRCKAPEIPNGNLKNERKDSYDSGTTVEFECNENYVLNGDINIKCENGQWIDIPECLQPCQISEDDLLKNNVLLRSPNDLQKTFKHRDEIDIKCKPNYKRQNQAYPRGECINGKIKYQKCLTGRVCRISQEEIDENNIELHENHSDEVFYGEGETILFQCKRGFIIFSEKSSQRYLGDCTDGKLNYPKCINESSV